MYSRKVMGWAFGERMTSDLVIAALNMALHTRRPESVKGIEVIVYEPALKEVEFYSSKVVNDLEAFKRDANIIIANRKTEALLDVENKVYSRDLFGGD